MQTNIQFSAYIRLSGPNLKCSQLGGILRGSLELEGFVTVREHEKGWYSAKFYSQTDYYRALRTSRWRIFNRYTIQVYKWERDFEFRKVIPLRAGDVVEGWVRKLGLEHFNDGVVTEIANLVCEPLGCHVLQVDTSERAIFVFEYNGLCLPTAIQVPNGPEVEVSYSRARQCYSCDGYGHIRWNCPGSNPEPRQWTTSTPNRASSSVSGPTQFHGCATVDPAETDIPSSSGITTPPRTVTEKNMPSKGAMIIEKGKENKPILYTLGETVSAIDVAVKVTQLNDENGNLRQLTIDPHIGDGPQCTKRVLCTSIDGADAIRTLEDLCRDKGASLVAVLDKSSVLDKDDQIVKGLGFSASHCAEMIFPGVGAAGSAGDAKGNCVLMWKKDEVYVSLDYTDPSPQHLKFRASWLTGESPFPVEDVCNYSGSSDESNLEGSSSCPTEPEELSSQSTKVSPDTPGSDALSCNCGDASLEEERSHEASSPSSPRSEYSYNGAAVYNESHPGSSDRSNLEGPSSCPTTSEELSSDSAKVSPSNTPGGDALSCNCGDASLEEERSYEASSLSSPRSEYSYNGAAVYDVSPPGSPDINISSSEYGDTDAEGSSDNERFHFLDLEEDLSTTDADDSADAEEISCASSAPPASSSSSPEEDDF